MGQYYMPVVLKNNWKKLNQPVMGALYSHETWWKRYGADHIHADTYWADR